MSTRFLAAFAMILLGGVTASHAALSVCNKSAESIQVSIGYNHSDYGWTSEGWWSIDSGDCFTAVSGDLDNQYYYVYGEASDGGTWSGKKSQDGGFFCTSEHKFTFHNDDYLDGDNLDCESAGLSTVHFLEIDTGDSTDFTEDLND
jgi:uncharacterized membrane protein